MSSAPLADKRILAIDPTPRGFGYVVFEGSERLVDWGTRNVRAQKNRESIRAVSELLNLYRPQLLVLEDVNARRSRRRKRVCDLLAALELHGRERGLTVRRISSYRVKQIFLARGIRNKHQVARFIAARFPELERYLPPERKPWMSEDPKTAIFDAAALVLVIFLASRASGLMWKSQVPS